MRLLLVEDHPELSHWLQKALTGAGFAVDVAPDGVAADHLLLNERYALAVLDVALPRLNGLDLLARLRKRGQDLPVLLLTARTDVTDRVKGLNLGADDYLTKPFELDELEARIRALLRRSVGAAQPALQYGALTYHDEGYFLLESKPLALTPRELAVLTALMHRRGRPVAKQQLFEQVFTLSDEANPESIELYVHRLRKKLQGSDVAIVTLRGLGYSLELCNAVVYAPRSLFYQLLLFFGLPLLALGGISIYTHYFSAMSAATLAYDRTLLASARTVAERLVVREGKLAVDVPYVVLDSFERNMNDQLYYEVISPQGKSISGYDDLPSLPPHIPRSTLYPALVHFYDAEYLGRPIRVAALFQPVNESGVSGMATILVAETLESRRYLARQMMIAALLSQGTVVVLTLILAFALLKRVLKPMRKLSGIMLRRDPGELTPLPRVLPWSEMQPLLVAFNRYIERLRLMVARQERFSADASHQLRTPLAVLKTQVGVALASDRPQQWRESLQAMSATLDNTVALTDRLLHLSRLKASEHSADRKLQPVNLAQVLRDACFSRLPQARSKQIDLGFEGEAACQVAGEPLLLAELCANLLDNALKYTPRQGVVTARLTRDKATGEGVLEIEDSGPGIALQDKALALQPFHRLDNVGDQPGAGLGLALVKDITAYHGTRPELLSSAALGGLLVRVRFRLLA